MSYQGMPPPGSSGPPGPNTMNNFRHGPPPPMGGPLKHPGMMPPAPGMIPPPGTNGPSPMGPPTNGQAPPYHNSGFSPQRPPYAGGNMTRPQYGSPPTGPPTTGPPPSGPPVRGSTPGNQNYRGYRGPPPPTQNVPPQGGNSMDPRQSFTGPPVGPYRHPGHGPLRQQGPPPGGRPQVSMPGPPPPGMQLPSSRGPGTPPTSGPPPQGGRLPLPGGIQHPPPPTSHMGQGGGDFHAGSSEINAPVPPASSLLDVPQGVGMIKSPSTGSLGRLPMPHQNYPQTPSPITETPDPLASFSGPPSERSSATSSPIPSQRYDALEGGTPFRAPPPVGHGPPQTHQPMGQGPPRSTGGPPQGFYGAPSNTAPPMGQHPHGPPPTGNMGPPTGPSGPPTGPPGPPTGPPGLPTGPPTGSINQPSGIHGKRQYPQPQPYYGGQGQPMPVAPPHSAANSVGGAQHYPQNQAMNNVNAGMGNLRIQQGDVKALNLLTERHILPPKKTPPPKAKISTEYQKLQVDTETFRSTLTAIPQTQSLLQKSRLPMGLVIHPYRDLSHLPVIQSSVIVRCRSCRTYINPFVTFPDQRRWKCNLCHRTNDLPEEFNFDPVTKTYGEPQRRPEIKSSTIEFIAPSEYMLRPPQPAVYLFLLDVSFGAVESGYLSVVCQTLLDSLDKMPGDARTLVGFLTFDSALHFYNLQEGASRPQMLICSDLEDVFLPCANDLLVNIQDCKELITDLLTELPNLFLGNKNTQTALGPALQAALKLAGPTGGRVTVFQSSLPTTGVGALKAREDPALRSAAKNIANLGPATDFYKKMALDFSGHQVAVDIFIISSQYADIATLAGVSKFSGGCVHYYPGFHTIQNPQQVERLEVDLRRYLTRKIGFEAVMRIRCTKGLSMHTFHGNFFVRSTDLLSLPNVSPDAGFAMQVSIEDPLHESTVACFQAALLYTSSKGERRIRVHTMCLPVTNQLSEVMAGADQRAIIGLLSRMAVDRSVGSSVEDARDALVNVCIDVLSAFKGSLPEGQTVGTLMVPTSMKLLPLYCLALLKNVAFRLGSSTKLDERVYAMEKYKCEPLNYIMLRVHPDLYALHTINDTDVILYKDNEVPQPTLVGLSSEYVNRDGAYLMDLGDVMYLFVCRNISPEFCANVLDVPDFQSIPDGMNQLPENENEMSDRIRSFIEWILDNRPFHAPLRVIRDDSRERALFIQHLVQDRSESSMSYYEFLQHLQKEVK